MEFRTSTNVDPALLDDQQFNGRLSYFVADEVHTASDGRVFISGHVEDVNAGTSRQFFFEVTDPDFEGFDQKGWKDQKAIFNEDRVNGLVQDAMNQGGDRLVVSDGESFPDLHEKINETITPVEKAPIPEQTRVAEPEAPTRAANEPIHFGTRAAALGDIEIDGQQGYGVIHAIEFDGDKPFLTGNFTTTGPDGLEHTRELIVAIDPERFPTPEVLSQPGMLDKIKSEDVVAEIFEAQRHTPVLIDRPESSSGVGEIRFASPDAPAMPTPESPNAAVMRGINNFLALPEGDYNIELASFAQMEEAVPGFTERYRSYLAGSPDADERAAKFAFLEGVGIDFIGDRVDIVDRAENWDDLVRRANNYGANLDIGSAELRAANALSEGIQTAKSTGRFTRLLAGVAGAGTAMTAVSASASVYEGHALTELTHQQFAAGDITEAQRDALLAFHANTTEAQLADTALGAADQFVIPSALFTIGVELQARDELTNISNATGLPESIYQMHARSMFGGHTASHDAILTVADELPHSSEGQSTVLHEAIDIKSDLRQARLELLTLRSPYAGMIENRIPEEVLANINARETVIADLEASLINEVEDLMRDPETVSEFINLMPISDRLDFIRALASTDPDFAENNPTIALALRNHVDGRGGGQLLNNQIDEARSQINASGGAALNEYIISRLMPETPSEDSWDAERVAQYYDPQTLADMNGELPQEFATAHNEGLNHSPSPEVAPEVDRTLSTGLG